jgi:cysteine desulfuration protein SufE
MLPAPAELKETLEALDNWEDRYAYLIDLGRQLPPLPESLKTDDILVRGCTSRVWLMSESRVTDSGVGVFHFTAQSDATIVQGLIAVLMAFYQDKTADQIRAIDMKAEFATLGLSEHLTPSRRNGFFAMVERITTLAA